MNRLLGNETIEVLLRLTIATLVGSLLGLNRELKGKPAGLRTHALVTLGAALMGVMCAPPGQLVSDLSAISRVIQGVLTGIGFLGGGVILHDNSNRRIHGLTTAATIWVAASLGVACGVGYWLAVGMATLLALLVLTFGGHVERWVNKVFGRDNPDSDTESSS